MSPAGQAPLVRHGLHDATCDPAQLEDWWQRWPHANLGLATGIIFDALDVDGPAGLAALRQLARTVDLRLPGPRVATGGGGWHHWFTPTGLGNRPPRGLAHVDWRGIGGCVLAPPSRHISGRQLPLAVRPRPGAATRGPGCPARAARPRPANHHPTNGPDRVGRPERPPALGHPYGRRVLADELAALGRATPGQRNRTLNRCAFKVYRYVAGGVLDEEDVTAAFTEAALTIGLDLAEIGRTLVSARTAGLANPRTVPVGPGPRTEEDGS